ncbi:hypothetical protein P1X14_07355 [Sphingomonas sp. AOB5]|uniref:hypothetical protein n=1 Tax=Sphingomonas sp. AOB5 TaxID=3034017 RepID=UPI0023F6C0A9|nr:hypothetical protein [Sphingomonas sp. AOB5]MDF7775057.1 hypothetical protein [Sphingomonas sp. AOB5]
MSVSYENLHLASALHAVPRDTRGMKRILVTAMMAISSCSPAPVKQVARPPQSPCDVAVAWLDETLRGVPQRKLVFDDHDRALREPGPRAIWNAPGTDQVVSGPDLAKFAGIPQETAKSAVGACPTVRTMLDRRNIAHGTKAVDAVASPYGLKATVINFSLPLLSKQGDEAIVMVSRQYEPLNGGGYLEHLKRRPDGRWTVVAVTGLWVS